MESTDALVSLRELESELGLERSELLLLLRELRAAPIHRGLRTYVSQAEVSRLRNHINGRPEPGSLTVLELEPAAHQPSPTWPQADHFAQLRLLRERLELLLLCADRNIWLESGELAALLGLRRVVAKDQDETGPYLERYGLRFRRLERPGQRSAWQVSAIEPAQNG